MTFALFVLTIIIACAFVILGGAAILNEINEHEHG